MSYSSRYYAPGRIRLALGAGWLEEEFEPLGAPPCAERGAVLEEFMAVLRRLWQEDLPSFEGRAVANAASRRG